jgi:mycothiol synthase
VATERQLAKAIRRLTPFAPDHRGVDVGTLLEQLRALHARGTLDLPEPRLRRTVERRRYADADMPRLLEACAAWIAEAGPCGYGHIGDLPHRIYEDLHPHGAPEELVEIWERGAEIAGLAINLRFGCAFDVFAAPSLRGTGFELEMLRAAAEVTANRLPDDETFVLSDVFDCDTARIDALTELDFERFRTWDHFRECALDTRVPLPEAPAGYVVRNARVSDAEQLGLARNSAFNAYWTGDSYRTSVMQKPGYDPEREIVVESPDGRIVALAVYWIDELNRTGHFEPVGTHRDFRRRGLARAAMVEAMRRMAAAGMRAATITHEAENVAALRLYESLGFRKRYETYGFRRPAPCG